MFKHLIPLDMLESLPLPLLRRLREIQRKRMEYRENQMRSAKATGTPQVNPSALSELLMNEL